ncbi:MAG: hypothetical protein IT208_05760 [Chthonomonadales bacterium]|nr:hypothetical protein [Chthonomonadales bacterium]
MRPPAFAVVLAAGALALGARGGALARQPGAAGSERPAPTPETLPPPSSAQAGGVGPRLGTGIAEITFGEGQIDGSVVHARNVTFTVGEYVLTAGQVDGDVDTELVFTGSPTLTYRDQRLLGDAIRFAPRTRAYTVENLRTALTPQFLQGRLLSPLFLSAESLSGRRREAILGTDVAATTCELPRPDYRIEAGAIRVDPGRSVTLKRASFVLWGRHVITLPTFIIPLDRRLARRSYTPYVGRSDEEGWFAKTAFNYLLSDRAPGLYRVDAMEKKGIGLGLEQAWDLARDAGLLALYAIPTTSSGRNLSGRLNARRLLGGGQDVSLDASYNEDSYYGLPRTRNLSSRLGYRLARGALETSLNVGRQSTHSSGFSTASYTANVSQGIRLGPRGRLNMTADYSRYESASSGAAGQRTEQLATRAQADYRADNYSLQVVANRSVPVGRSTAQSYFGGLERMPEVALTNYRFTGGWLSRVPLNLALAVGRYSEGGGAGTAAARVRTERLVAGLDVSSLRYRLTTNTDLNLTAGFQQSLYGEGAAQYVVRGNGTLTQRWGRHSGLNLSYSYQRPEGGTPFRFDLIGNYHTLNADVGFLDDRRVQLTARVGYDFAQSAFGGISAPWQTLSANLLVRPVDWARLRSLFTFDPNGGRFLAVTNDLRLRGRQDFALDVVTRYDPRRHRFAQVNGYLDLPIGRLWRVMALMQYNGYLNRFESRHLRIVRDLHCLEAALTYIDSPFGYQSQRQIYFELRIKALPVLQRFTTGAFGQSVGPSIGGID